MKITLFDIDKYNLFYLVCLPDISIIAQHHWALHYIFPIFVCTIIHILQQSTYGLLNEQHFSRIIVIKFSFLKLCVMNNINKLVIQI